MIGKSLRRSSGGGPSWADAGGCPPDPPGRTFLTVVRYSASDPGYPAPRVQVPDERRCVVSLLLILLIVLLVLAAAGGGVFVSNVLWLLLVVALVVLLVGLFTGRSTV